MIYTHYADYWELFHKITVDYINKIIYVNEGVDSFDIKIDLYSDLKEVWNLPSSAYRYNRFKLPIRVVGGDDTVDGEKAGDIYFLREGWKLAYDPTVTAVTGTLFSDDYDTAYYYSVNLRPLFPAKVSSLVSGVEIESTAVVPTAQEIWEYGSRTLTSIDANINLDQQALDDISSAVWNKLLADMLVADSAGERLQALLTVNKYLGLQK